MDCLAPVISVIIPNVRIKHSQDCWMLSMVLSWVFKSRKYWEDLGIGWGNSFHIARSCTNILLGTVSRLSRYV